jgi:O-antigen/teichoic acid export membrane protein
VLVFTLVREGQGLTILAMISVAALVAQGALTVAFTKRCDAGIKVDRSCFHRPLIRAFSGYSGATFLSQVADLLRFHLTPYMITVFMSVNKVTTYSIAMRLTDYYTQLVVSMAGVLIPVFSRLEGEGRHEDIQRRLIISIRLCGGLSLGILFGIMLFGSAFIECWMGRQYSEAAPLLVMLSIAFNFALMQQPGVQLMFGLSQHRYFALQNWGEGCANLLLGVILIPRYGLWGAAIAAALPMTITKLVLQPWYIGIVSGCSVKTIYKELWINLFCRTVPLFGLWWVVLGGVSLRTYADIGIYGCLFSLSYSIYFCYVVMTRSERAQLARLLAASLSRGMGVNEGAGCDQVSASNSR